MNALMKQVETVAQHSSIFLFPALLVFWWLVLFGSAIAAMSSPFPLQESIEKALSARSAPEPARGMAVVRR